VFTPFFFFLDSAEKLGGLSRSELVVEKIGEAFCFGWQICSGEKKEKRAMRVPATFWDSAERVGNKNRSGLCDCGRRGYLGRCGTEAGFHSAPDNIVDSS